MLASVCALHLCQDLSLGLSVFVGVWTSASARALHLPTNSVRVFRGRSNLRSLVKSDTSLRSVVEMKLGEAWPTGGLNRVGGETSCSGEV